MSKSVRRILALVLALALLLPVLAGCSNSADAPETTKPAPTEPEEEAKVLKVLTLGHSLAVNTGHMLALICHAEGFENVLVGTLYYSGCPLNKHVQYLTNDEPAYNLYLSSTDTPNVTPLITEAVTMKYALTYEYWDIIVMQGGVFEVAKEETYTDGNIQIIQDYVNQHKLNPLAKFAWHMPWAFPTDNDLRDTFSGASNGYYKNYEQYGHDRRNFYKAMTSCVEKYIVTDETFDFLIPSGTAIECAVSSYLTEKEIFRDYAHAGDLGCVIGSYVWYCKLAGLDKLDAVNLEKVPKHFLRTHSTLEDWVLTEAEKLIIVEAVNSALEKPLEMTQSQYTERPAE
ncbi:MAG: DUF4886 domain-containing protein [Oscillospiraceae bacterium]|nr:DUF4886 domain-containing protein [Oscillospiraceae bacterium]